MAGHAIITGGSSGIGLAFAKQLAGQGMAVSLIARDPDRLEQARAAIQNLAGASAKIECISADIRNQAECQKAVAQACATHGSPSWAVACAGIVEPGLFVDQPLDKHEDQIKTNYLGSLYLAHEIVPQMVRNGGGKFLFVSSGAAFSGLYGYGAYGASKFAVRGLAESLNVELKNHNVQITLVYPGDTDTPQLHRELKQRPKVTAIIAGPARILSPDEVAAAAINGAKSGKFLITYGWRLVLLSLVHSLIGAQFRAHQIKVAKKAEQSAGQ